MNTSVVDIQDNRALNVQCTDDSLIVDLNDGRTMTIPLAWYPRLQHATREERKDWKLIGEGIGIHWNVIDEDISIEGLILGRASGESQESFNKWLQARKK